MLFRKDKYGYNYVAGDGVLWISWLLGGRTTTWPALLCRCRSSHDYSKVYAIIQEIVETRKYQLIERLAQVIADTVLTQFDVDAVTITVHKPHAPIGGPIHDVAVTIERTHHA